MERSVYNTIFHQEVKDVRAAKMALIKSTPIFNVLTETLQGSLCDALQPLEKDANSVLFYKGDEGELFYIVKEGTVEISIGDKVCIRQDTHLVCQVASSALRNACRRYNTANVPRLPQIIAESIVT